LLSPLLEPSLLFFLLSVRSLLGAVAVTPPKKKNHTLEPFKDLNFQRNLLSNFMFILSIMLPNLSIPDVYFPVLLSTLIRNRFQVKPATLLTPK
jgi:hypothetical protein